MMENWAKSSKEQFIKTSSEKLTSLLKLHSMDESIFVEKKEIKYKPDALQHYYNLHNSSDLDSCGKAWAESFAEHNGYPEFKSFVKASYACLLKMVLIHFMDPRIESKNIFRKYDQFENFLTKELNVVMGREINLALYYFAGHAGKLLGIQPNMSYSKAKKILLSTAWDLLLLRIPELLLRPDCLPELNTAYVVSSETKLLGLGNLFNIESIYYTSINSDGRPAISFDVKVFKDIFTENDFKNLKEKRLKLTYDRIPPKKKNFQAQELDWIVEDLETQLGYLCR